MRTPLLAAALALATISSAMAQNTGNAQQVPTAIGNRANGNSYQPTPGEVAPREKAAGVAPSAAQQQQTNNELRQLDSRLLRSEGLSTSSVPGSGH